MSIPPDPPDLGPDFESLKSWALNSAVPEAKLLISYIEQMAIQRNGNANARQTLERLVDMIYREDGPFDKERLLDEIFGA